MERIFSFLFKAVSSILNNILYKEQIQNDKTKEKVISLLKTQIRAHYYFEIEPESLQGYLAFCSLFAQASKENRIFQDQTFPAVPDSIVVDPLAKNYRKWRAFEWLRPIEFVEGDKYVMFDKIQSVNSSRIGLGKLISPYDIQQGSLGDCYFLSVLSSLAQEPQRILSLFITQVLNPYGIYCVKICHDGEWKAVYVDDRIPCKNGRPGFTRASQREIWVCVLEKAWAKLFNGYHNIESGYCREAFRDLTGAPTQTINSRDPIDSKSKMRTKINEKLPILLREALSKENKFVVTAGADTDQIITESISHSFGLISSHAYSIIGIKEVIDAKGLKVTLLRMRNPWGRKEWTGDWSESSPLWTPELREKLRVDYHRDNGIFYMAIEDFQRFFSDISICYYHDGFNYASLKLYPLPSKHGIRSQYSTLKVTQPGTYYVSIVEKNRRTVANKADYNYLVARLIIIEDATYRCVGMIQKKDREIFIKCVDLKPGKVYYIQSKVFYHQNEINSYVLSVYGTASVDFCRSDKSQMPQYLIERCFLKHARDNPEKMSFSRAKTSVKCISLNLKDGFGYYYVQNNDPTAALDLEIDFNGSNGVKLKKPYNLQNCKFIIQAKKELIIPMTISALGYSYKCAESYSYK